MAVVVAVLEDVEDSDCDEQEVGVGLVDVVPLAVAGRVGYHPVNRRVVGRYVLRRVGGVRRIDVSVQ